MAVSTTPLKHILLEILEFKRISTVLDDHHLYESKQLLYKQINKVKLPTLRSCKVFLISHLKIIVFEIFILADELDVKDLRKSCGQYLTNSTDKSKRSENDEFFKKT